MKLPDIKNYWRDKAATAIEKGEELLHRAREVYGDEGTNVPGGPEGRGTITQLATDHPSQRRLQLSHAIVHAGIIWDITDFEITGSEITTDPRQAHLAQLQRELLAHRARSYLLSSRVNSLGIVSLDLRRGIRLLPQDYYLAIGNCMLNHYDMLHEIELHIGPEFPEHPNLDGGIISRIGLESPGGRAPTT